MNNPVFQLQSEPDIKLLRGDVSYSRKILREDTVTKVETEITFLEDSQLIHFFDTVDVKILKPKYIWTPALCPEEGDIIGDHVFRSPVIILQDNTSSFALIPDLDLLTKQRFSILKTALGTENRAQSKMFMNLVDGKAEIGFSDYECRGHFYYHLTGKPLDFPKGHILKLGYYILSNNNISEPMDISSIVSFLWKKYASRYIHSSLPQKLSFEEYAKTSYKSVFSLGEFIEFKMKNGKKSGGFKTGSADNKTPINSYFKIPSQVVWFHAWFNSFRTAFGLKYYAKKWNNANYAKAALLVKELLLAAPDSLDNGFIPAIYAYESSKWWNGVPRLGAGEDVFNLTASAHTAQWMLLWHRYLEKDTRLYVRAKKIANAFIDLQAGDGSFPGYMNKDGTVLDLLKKSGHSAMVSLLLCELYEDEKDERLLESIVKSCQFYIKKIISESKYHDFETFFSCSEKPLDFYDHRSKQHAQNNLCLYWITETLLRAYSFTKEAKLLTWALHCLDRLSLYQQIWNPPYLSLYTFGGFGVMNTDGEWNDTRQVFFADTYFLAYKLSGEEEYLQRGTAALKAGCALVCHPEHKDINPLRYNSFADGFAPESYAHIGLDGSFHRSGFDWGAGALATMSALISLKHPEFYAKINPERLLGRICG